MKPSYHLRTTLTAILGPERARQTAGADHESLLHQVTDALRSRYGTWEGRVNVRPLAGGEVEVQFYPHRMDEEAEQLHAQAIGATRERRIAIAAAKWIEAANRNPVDPKYWFHAGVANFELHRYPEAHQQLERTLRLCPFHHRAHLVLGTLFLKLRKLEDAERHLRAAVSLCPNDPLARLNLGAVYSVLRKYEDGIREFQEAIRLAPTDPRPCLGLAKVYSLLGKSERAEYYYRQVIRLDKSGALRRQAQMNLTVSGAPAQARGAETTLDSQLETTQVLAPEQAGPDLREFAARAGKYASLDPDSLFALAYRSYLSLDYEKSLDQYAAYCLKRPTDASGWFGLGETAIRAGHLRLALHSLQRACELAAKPTFFKQLGLVYYLLWDFAQAEEALKKARDLGKKDSVLLSLLGETLARRGEFGRAAAIFEEALQENRNNVKARYELAKLLQGAGNTTGALQQLDEILLSPVDSPVREQAEKLLEAIRKPGADKRGIQAAI